MYLGVDGIVAQLYMGVYPLTLMYFNIVLRRMGSVLIKSRELMTLFVSSEKVSTISEWLHHRKCKAVSNLSRHTGQRLDLQSHMTFIIFTVPHNLFANLTANNLNLSGSDFISSSTPLELMRKILGWIFPMCLLMPPEIKPINFFSYRWQYHPFTGNSFTGVYWLSTFWTRIFFASK